MNERGHAERTTGAWFAYALFFGSGAASLALEVLWLGALTRVFGATAEAAGVTLAVFFLGLGAGAWAGGRAAPRVRAPLRAYGWLEVGVGATAGLGLLAGDLHGRIYGALVEAAASDAGSLLIPRALLAIALVGPGAFLMGATFPLVGEHVARGRGDLGRRGSLLYGINTLGAAGGAFAATFLLRPLVGTRGAWQIAGATALVVGVAAIWAGGRRTPIDAPRTNAAPRLGVLPALACASGFLAIALEVLWNRAVLRAYPNSLYVFGTVLVVFLLALAVGAGASRALMRRAARPDALLGVLLAVAGVLVAATPAAWAAVTGGLRPPAPGLAWEVYVRGLVFDVVLVVGPAAAALGTVLPWLFRLAERRGPSPGRALGRLQAWNTLGAVCGAIAAGFLLARVLGLWAAIGLAGAAYAVLGLGVALASRKVVPVGVALLAVVLAGLSFLFAPPAIRLGPSERLLGSWDGPSGHVAVIERGGDRVLVFDNVFVLGGTHDARWEGMQAHVPLLLHPAPRKVLLLGLGTGITAGAALDHPVTTCRAIELVPEIVEASRAFFSETVNGLYEDPRASVCIDDARHAVRWSNETWDVVVGDLFFPWEPGTAYLYTREHFAAVRERLEPGGLLAQWLPCYQMSLDELRGIAATMVEVFPRVTLWRGDFFADRPLLCLVGHVDETPLDAEGLRNRARDLPASGPVDLVAGAETIPLHLYAGNLTAARTLLADARQLTDDDPWIAWTAPRSERRRQSDPGTLAVGKTLLAFETSVLETVPPEEDPFLEGLLPADLRLVTAGLVLRRAAIAIHEHDRRAYVRRLRDYVRLVPERVRPDLNRWIE